MSRSSKRALSILSALCAVPLPAQNFGEITGAVSDSSGAIIAGASVAVIHTAINQVRQAVTNRTGNYSVPYLAPGLYDVRAEMSGFKTATRRGVDLEVGAVARIDFAMEVGDVSQQMEVVGGAPLLATETVTLGTVIENRRIVDLPMRAQVTPNANDLGSPGRVMEILARNNIEPAWLRDGHGVFDRSMTKSFSNESKKTRSRYRKRS